jgi:hypothetical protein
VLTVSWDGQALMPAPVFITSRLSMSCATAYLKIPPRFGCAGAAAAGEAALGAPVDAAGAAGAEGAAAGVPADEQPISAAAPSPIAPPPALRRSLRRETGPRPFQIVDSIIPS